MEDKPDMHIAIDVLVSGTIASDGTLDAAARYEMVSCIPPPGEDVTVVAGDGHIDLRHMICGDAFSRATDITFNLSGSVSNHRGERIRVEFVTPARQAVKITHQEGAHEVDGLVPYFPDPATTTQLVIDDQDQEKSNYNYCLSIVAQGEPRAVCSLDPAITNR